MKHLIIEGTDRIGKDTLLKAFVEHFGYENVTIRHFGKPLKLDTEDSFKFQQEAFKKEARLLQLLKSYDIDIHNYFENVVIWNRSHIGEYVYGQMFRGHDPKRLLDSMISFEQSFLREDTSYVQLYSEPEFALRNEDGNSFSQSIEQKMKETNLFMEAYGLTTIKKKVAIKVDDELGDEFRKKEDIFDEAKKIL